MKIDYRKEYSSHLGRDMEYKVYGHGGKPVLIFPTSSGRFFQYEDFGMIDVCKPFIDDGRVQLFCVDGIDWESWDDKTRHPYERIRRHEQYYHYVMDEFVPSVLSQSLAANGDRYFGKILTSGCSMGATHAVNFFFRRPDVFDSVVALSGLYHTRSFFGDYMDELVYLNCPLAYLPNLTDPHYMDLYQESKIVVACGQGAWEDEMLKDTLELKSILERKGIPAWIDIWGADVNHDWPWWRRMMPYFLGHVLD